MLYLLGDFDGAARLAPDDAEGWMAAGARDRDANLVARARERWITAQRHGKHGPHADRFPRPLSPWDWIEETYRLEAELLAQSVPSHLEMLRRTGLLSPGAEPAQILVTPPVLRKGRRFVLDADAPRSPALEVLSERTVVVTLSPSLVLEIRCYRTMHAGASRWRPAPTRESGSSRRARPTFRARRRGRRIGLSCGERYVPRVICGGSSKRTTRPADVKLTADAIRSSGAINDLDIVAVPYPNNRP